MGSCYPAGPVETRRRTKKEETMNLKMLIAAIAAVVALLGSAEADCNRYGCCYCHQTEGYEINSGSTYMTTCRRGSECCCDHDRHGFIGKCKRRRRGRGDYCNAARSGK